MNSSYNSKGEMTARLAEVLKGVATLETNKSRTPEEEAQYHALSVELTSLDTTLKAMDGRTM